MFMKQMIGKNIDTYYNIRYNMQSCNTCSSNPKNKIYNYQTFNTPKNDNTDNMLIEGLDNATKVDIVSSNYKTFNELYADYLKCSTPNNVACTKLQTEYDAQTNKVNGIETNYNTQQKIYDDCENLKTRCKIINTRVNQNQEVIDGLNKKMEGKQGLLTSFKNVSTTESTKDFLKTNNMDLCDKNIDYSNKVDNLTDLIQNYNTNKGNINNQITFKEKDIYNNDIDLKTSSNAITTYTANRDAYSINSTNNYNEANRQRRNCWRSCRGRWWRRRCHTSCNNVAVHNAHWRNHYNNEGNRWKDMSNQEQANIVSETNTKNKIEEDGKKYKNEKIQLENSIKSINTTIETNKTNITNLKNDCSREQLNAIEKIGSDIEDKINSKRTTEVEYKNICNSKQINCDTEYAVFQPIKQNYKKEKKVKKDLKNRHEICVDPDRNDCKDIYNEYRHAKSGTKIATSRVEPFDNYEDNDTAYEVHEKIKANYKKVQGDFNKLKTNEQEMNIKLSKKNSIYESTLEKHDKVMYTNLLLTAFATTLIYVIFVDM